MLRLLRSRLPVLAKGVGVLGMLGAIGFWSWQLLAPLPAIQPLPVAEPLPDPADSRIVQWFVPGPLQVEIEASGLMLSGDGAFVVLSVNGGTPRAYGVGDRLVESVTVREIDARAIVVDKGGELVRVAIPDVPSVSITGTQTAAKTPDGTPPRGQSLQKGK